MRRRGLIPLSVLLALIEMGCVARFEPIAIRDAKYVTEEKFDVAMPLQNAYENFVAGLMECGYRKNGVVLLSPECVPLMTKGRVECWMSIQRMNLGVVAPLPGPLGIGAGPGASGSTANFAEGWVKFESTGGDLTHITIRTDAPGYALSDLALADTRAAYRTLIETGVCSVTRRPRELSRNATPRGGGR